MAARVHEGRRVVVQNLLLEGYRRHLIDLDFNMYAGKHIEEIVEMIASRDDFDDYMNYIKKYYHSNPMENNDVYVDIDGDGNIDAEDIYITSKIGLFEEITDPNRPGTLPKGKSCSKHTSTSSFRWGEFPGTRTLRKSSPAATFPQRLASPSF